MKRRETKMWKDLSRQIIEYQELQIANERSKTIDQFFASQNTGDGYEGVSGYRGVVGEEDERKDEDNV